jgi:RNA polymerase sigma-70 factor, ECF subfamily
MISSDTGDRSRLTDNSDALFEQSWPIAWSVAWTILGDWSLAEDAAQDAMVKIVRSYPSYDPDQRLEPWVRRIAVNAAIDVARRRRRTVQLKLKLERAHSPPVAAPAEAELTSNVRALSRERRLIVVLHYWLDYSLTEIGEMLQLPAGTVASRLSRALDDLRRMEAPHD